ncbi:MAG: peptidase [Acidobacteria bacterium]|nr:peptidase [Acidobacteriota bacterium]
MPAVLLMISVAAQAQAPASAPSNPAGSRSSLVKRVGNTGFVQLHAPSFQPLSPREKQLAYWLVQASIAIDPVIYDQLSRFGVRQKRLLEEIAAHPRGMDPAVLHKITDYALLFWANRGNHNENTSQKFVPEFTADELRAAALQAAKNGAFVAGYADLPPLSDGEALTRELNELAPAFFDPNFEPMTTAKSPKGDQDIIQASSNTFYEGVTRAELANFHDEHALNSRVVKTPDGALVEQVYRAGTPDGRIPPGLYSTFLKMAIEKLERARKFADPDQAQVIADLIRYYETGDFSDWLKFDEDWVQNNATVDFANGFIEIYRDARGAKGSSQSFVTVTDKPVTTAMTRLAQNAEYFEQKAPWNTAYKKTAFKPPLVKAVETLIETGDFHVTTVGDNLPNENQIHEKFGTKNFLFTGSDRALTAASGHKVLEEFGADATVIARARKYGEKAGSLMTAMHEVIGHGSGKLSSRIAATGAESYLKEYFSTLEEGRADLMALWNAWDPRLKDLGLVQDQEEVAKAMYDSAALTTLTQLRRIPRGDTIEEDHQRDRQLIARYIQDSVPGSITQFDRDGKTYIKVQDYQKMKQGVGMLLSELMRIKAEGDYDGIKSLVDRYGVHFDPALRDQVVARFKKLSLPTYWAGVNPELDAAQAGISVRDTGDPVRQYLLYGSMYCTDVKVPGAPQGPGRGRRKPQ